MKLILSLAVLILTLSLIATPSYSSTGSMHVGNYGISGTLTDPWTGDVSSFYSVNTGLDKYYQSELDSIMKQIRERTDAIIAKSSGATTSQIMYEPGRNLRCDGTLVTVDEMLKNIDTSNLYIESKYQEYPIPEHPDSNAGESCNITIHALDDTFNVQYMEQIFVKSDNAKLYYPSFVEEVVSAFIDEPRIIENNLGENSHFLFAGDDVQRGAFAQTFQKDEYNVLLVSHGYEGFFLMDKEAIPKWAEMIRSRVNNSPYPDCMQYFPITEIQRIFGDKYGKIQSKSIDVDSAKTFNFSLLEGVEHACMNSLSIPHYEYGLMNSKVDHFILTYDSEQRATESMNKNLNPETDKKDNKFLQNTDRISEYIVSKKDNIGVLAFQDGKNIVGLYMMGSYPDANHHPDYAFTLTDDLMEDTFTTLLDVYLEQNPSQESSIDKPASLTQPSSNEAKAPVKLTPKSPDAIRVVSVIPVDQQGRTVDSFPKGKPGFVKVTVTADSPTDALITTSLFDSDYTSLGVGSVKTRLVSGVSHELLMSVYIPKDARIGDASIFVNTLTDWPAFNGVPLTDEFGAQVTIR